MNTSTLEKDLTVSTALLTALKTRGATALFGIPGDFALPFFKQIESSQILPLATLSHEPAVGFAADAAARMSGLGVAVVTYGAGALNMVNSVACAYAESSPLVIISGAPSNREAHAHWMLHHQVKNIDSQINIYKEITCAQCRLDDASTAHLEIARVLDACQHYSKPVLIEVPRDQVALSCQNVPPRTYFPYQQEAVEACSRLILARIQSAKSPVLLVDIELKRFNCESVLGNLAKCLGIPVVTTFMGRGVLAHEDVLGVYLGVAGDTEITDLVEQSDCLLLMGTILSDTNFNLSRQKIDMQQAIIACNYQVIVGYSQFNNIPIKALVEALLHLSRCDFPTPTNPALRPSLPKKAANTLPAPIADEQDIEPMDVIYALNQLLEKHAYPIVSDMGDCLFSAMSLPPNIEIMAPAYYATMGFGVPAGMGVQFATQTRPIILVGDGAFQMTGWELKHCQRLGLNPIVIVFNNQSWEMLRVFQPESQFNDLEDWQIAKLAEDLGGKSRRVVTRAQLSEAFNEAIEQTENFVLIEVMLKSGTLSDALKNFVNAVKRGH